MLYIFLQGGLGNQLFQYAAALRLKERYDVRIIKAPKAHSGRDYRATMYYRVESVDESPPLYLVQLEPFGAWGPQSYYDNLVLQGYFQFLPAIEPVLPQLRQDLLRFFAPYQLTLRPKYRITDPSSVGFIHVRRGDYLTAPPDLHWIMDTEYYRKALIKINANLRWIVISDDVAWCREQELFTNISTIEIADEPDELNGLALMSMCCGGAIIGNSTYSWWGAMLGAEPAGAQVVYPSLWFSYAKPDLFPSRWTRL